MNQHLTTTHYRVSTGMGKTACYNNRLEALHVARILSVAQRTSVRVSRAFKETKRIQTVCVFHCGKGQLIR